MENERWDRDAEFLHHADRQVIRLGVDAQGGEPVQRLSFEGLQMTSLASRFWPTTLGTSFAGGDDQGRSEDEAQVGLLGIMKGSLNLRFIL